MFLKWGKQSLSILKYPQLPLISRGKDADELFFFLAKLDFLVDPRKIPMEK